MENKKGFTLIELIIVVALIGVVLSTIFTPITFSLKNFNIQNEKSNTISNARTTMNFLTRQIKKSNEIDVVNNTIIMDSNIYKLKDRTLFRDDKLVIEGIDELIIDKVDKTISIEIAVKDSQGKDYRLSSITNIR